MRAVVPVQAPARHPARAAGRSGATGTSGAGVGTRGAAGFSLAELMVVLTIAGILLSMAVPNFVRFNSRDRVETAAYDVHRTLILARQKALARRTPYRVSVLDAGGTLRVERREAGVWVRDPAEDLVLTGNVHMNASFGENPGNEHLILEPQGTVLAEDAPAVFRFSNDQGDSAVVRAVRTGRIRTRVD